MQKNWQRNTWLMAFCVLCTSASYTMLIPFLPLYLLDLGTPEADVPFWSSAVFSITFCIAAIMAPIWGRIADRYGRKKMAVRACIGLTLSYAVGGLVTSPEGLFGMRILQGFANGFIAAVLAITAAIAPRQQLGVAIGTIQTGQITGSVMGPLIGGVLAHLVGMRTSFFLAAGFLALATLLGIVFLDTPPTPTQSEKTSAASGSLLADFHYAWQNKALLAMLLLCAVVNMANMVLQPVISLYVAELQGTMENVALNSGIVFSLGGIAGALSTRFWGRFGQTNGYYRAMGLAFLGAGACLFLQYFPTELYGFAVLQFAFGLMMAGTMPAINAVMVEVTPADFHGRVFGLTSSANQTGAMLGPIIGGLLSTALGIRPIFLVTGTLLLLLGTVLWQRRKHTGK